MSKSPRSLSDILEDMVSVLDRLLTFSREKQEAVVRGDVASLEDIVRREEDALRLVESLGKEQEMLLAGGWGQPSPQNAKDVTCLEKAVRDKILLLKTINEQNQRLISKSLDMVRYELRLLVPKNGYGPAIKMQAIKFDQKT